MCYVVIAVRARKAREAIAPQVSKLKTKSDFFGQQGIIWANKFSGAPKMITK